jgi:hypothetical protein
MVFNLPKAHDMFLRAYLNSEVVAIEVRGTPGNTISGATGFYVEAPSGKTFLMTNRHVCADSRDGTVWVGAWYDKLMVQSKIVFQSDVTDLCLVEAPEDVLGLHVAKSMYFGEEIHYLGHPRLDPTIFVTGEASGLKEEDTLIGIVGGGLLPSQCAQKDMRTKEVNEFFELLEVYPQLANNPLLRNGRNVVVCVEHDLALITTMIIYPGASGSPVVDFWGDIVAVVYSSDDATGGWGYAVPLGQVKEILKGR